MGTGRSPGGGGTGAKYTATTAPLPPVTNTVVPPSPTDVAKGDTLPKGGVAYDEFLKMSDDEKADVIDKAIHTGVPMFLDDSELQRFAYFTGMSDKPTIVPDSQMDQLPGKDLFRTVSNAYNRQTDIGYKSTDIYKQIAYGDFTMYSDSGGSAYGKAIYFADNYTESAWYGSGNNDITMRAKVTSGKTITTSSLNSAVNAEMRSGSKLGKVLRSVGSKSQGNLYALAKGYSVVIDKSAGYYMVLNRGALTMSNIAKPTKRGGSW